MGKQETEFVYKRGSCLYEYIWIMECQQEGGEEGIQRDLKSKGLSQTSLQKEQIRRKNEFNTYLDEEKKLNEPKAGKQRAGIWRDLSGEDVDAFASGTLTF